jgi:hypothetical protein
MLQNRRRRKLKNKEHPIRAPWLGAPIAGASTRCHQIEGRSNRERPNTGTIQDAVNYDGEPAELVL